MLTLAGWFSACSENVKTRIDNLELKSISFLFTAIGFHSFFCYLAKVKLKHDGRTIEHSREDHNFHSLSKASLASNLSLIFMRNPKKDIG